MAVHNIKLILYYDTHVTLLCLNFNMNLAVYFLFTPVS
jgi:hypothetical protein